MNTNERIKIFKSLMGQVFGKEDVDYFVATLKRMGYFTAPASTKYHGKYQKHFVYLNDDTMYVVEDISGANVDKYHYEINFLPEYGVKVTHND